MLFSRLLAITLACLLVSVASLHSATNHHVILITIDGLAAYYLADPAVPMPTLRKLIHEGASAENLRVCNPTVTWPNHTTLITGVGPDKHSVLFNGVLVRARPGQPARVDSRRDQKELVSVPTLFDEFHRAGLRTAAINWPCTRGATNLDDNFPDVLEPISHTTPRLRDELVGTGILASTNEAAFRALSAAARDQVWTAAAAHVIRTRRPNLLLFHLLATDTLQHRYGPQSPAAYAALALADANLAELLRALQAAGIAEETTVFVASDHGFEKPSRLINPNVIFRKAGLIRPGARTRVQAIAEGGVAFVYFTDPETAVGDRPKVLELLRGQEGIGTVFTPDKFAELRLPNPANNPQMADLLLAASDGYAFHDEIFDEKIVTELVASSGSHGYLASDPKMNGIFIAAGRGVKAGVKLETVDNIDIAPTIAALLGQKLATADGKVIAAILGGGPR
jgi:predicted AlkP superfamily pyrophosphatase or phosphodiesterase